jgi:hypothetical protein
LIYFYSTGELKLENNCFINSPVSSLNFSSIVDVQINSTVVSINNYVDAIQTELRCPYVIEFNVDRSMVQCRKDVVFDAATCSRDGSGVAPTGTTAMPVASPAPTTISPKPAAPTSSQQPVLTTAAPVAATPGPVVPTSSSPQPVLTTAAPVNATQAPVSTTAPTSPSSKAPTSAGEVTQMGVWTFGLVVVVVPVLSFY